MCKIERMANLGMARSETHSNANEDTKVAVEETTETIMANDQIEHWEIKTGGQQRHSREKSCQLESDGDCTARKTNKDCVSPHVVSSAGMRCIRRHFHHVTLSPVSVRLCRIELDDD